MRCCANNLVAGLASNKGFLKIVWELEVLLASELGCLSQNLSEVGVGFKGENSLRKVAHGSEFNPRFTPRRSGRTA